MKSIITISLIFISTLVGCFHSAQYYPNTKVKILEVKKINNQLIIYYSTLPETIYYSPGINYQYTEIKDSLYIKILREKINKQCKYMAKSNIIDIKKDSLIFKKYGSNVYKVNVPNNFSLNIEESNLIKKIYLLDK